MPYIPEQRRQAIEAGADPENMGELTYKLTMDCLRYRDCRVECFQVHGEIVGALTCATQEWYRRAIALYEDGAIERNGDLFPLSQNCKDPRSSLRPPPD